LIKKEGTHAAGTVPNRFPWPILPHKLLNIFNLETFTNQSTKYKGVEK